MYENSDKFVLNRKSRFSHIEVCCSYTFTAVFFSELGTHGRVRFWVRFFQVSWVPVRFWVPIFSSGSGSGSKIFRTRVLGSVLGSKKKNFYLIFGHTEIDISLNLERDFSYLSHNTSFFSAATSKIFKGSSQLKIQSLKLAKREGEKRNNS